MAKRESQFEAVRIARELLQKHSLQIHPSNNDGVGSGRRELPAPKQPSILRVNYRRRDPGSETTKMVKNLEVFQDATGVRPDHDAAANIADLCSPLAHDRSSPRPRQAEGGGQAADASPHDDHPFGQN